MPQAVDEEAVIVPKRFARGHLEFFAILNAEIQNLVSDGASLSYFSEFFICFYASDLKNLLTDVLHFELPFCRKEEMCGDRRKIHPYPPSDLCPEEIEQPCFLRP